MPLRDLGRSLLRWSEPFGRLDGELRSEERDAVVVVRDHHVADPGAVVRGERVPLVDAREHADERPVDVGPVVAQHLLLPLAEVRRADPDGVVDPGVDETRGAVVDERVLARPRAEALAEQDELRPRASGGRSARR